MITLCKREGELKAGAMSEVRRLRPAYQILLLATAGGPDRVIVGDARTTFWEFKHGTPDFESQGNQELCCRRLAAQGAYCRYVIWQENADGFGQRTMIVHPDMIARREGSRVVPETFCTGFNHAWLARQILWAHRLH